MECAYDNALQLHREQLFARAPVTVIGALVPEELRYRLLTPQSCRWEKTAAKSYGVPLG
jgi:hypothetical protein